VIDVAGAAEVRVQRRVRRDDRPAAAALRGATAAAPAGRLRAAQALTRWRADPDLAGLQAPSELVKLPADEQKDCIALWAEGDDLLVRLGGTAPKR
jgi:hypothetical protein